MVPFVYLFHRSLKIITAPLLCLSCQRETLGKSSKHCWAGQLGRISITKTIHSWQARGSDTDCSQILTAIQGKKIPPCVVSSQGEKQMKVAGFFTLRASHKCSRSCFSKKHEQMMHGKKKKKKVVITELLLL